MAPASTGRNGLSFGLTRISETVSEFDRLGRDWLTESEQTRLKAITGPQRRRQFLAGCWSLRKLLAAEYGGDPIRDWGLRSEAMQPPRLMVQLPQPLHLSVSHSGDMLACAVAPCALGIDIEVFNPSRPIRDLLDATLSHHDRARIATAHEADLASEFYISWTLKEAWIKQGTPLQTSGIPPYSSLDTDRAPADKPGNGRVWSGPDFTLALVAAPVATVRASSAFSQACGLKAPESWCVRPTDESHTDL